MHAHSAPSLRRGSVRSFKLALALVAALAVLGACSKSVEVTDAAALEKEIGTGIEDQLGVPVTVECPEDGKAEEGSSFDCTATDDEGTELPVEVSLKDGEPRWDMQAVSITTAEEELAANLSGQAGAEVTVECPKVLIAPEVGNGVDCLATETDTGAEFGLGLTVDEGGEIAFEILE